VNYINRYAPSRDKVIGYLMKKNISNPEELISEVWYNESIMCDIWVKSFIATGKWQKEIKLKLLKKGFPKEIIQEKLDFFDEEIHSWESNKNLILHQIKTLEQRSKSKRIIEITLLGKYPYFASEIKETLSCMDDMDSLKKEVQKYKNRYTVMDKKTQEKCINSLLRKGFSYQKIKSELFSQE
jgi:SOS response regulatory protein OraA/RecX